MKKTKKLINIGVLSTSVIGTMGITSYTVSQSVLSHQNNSINNNLKAAASHDENQNLISKITPSDITNKLSISPPSPDNALPTSILKPVTTNIFTFTLTSGTIDVKLAIIYWIPNNVAGNIKYTVQISKLADVGGNYHERTVSDIIVSGFETSSDYNKNILNDLTIANVENNLNIIASKYVKASSVNKPADFLHRSIVISTGTSSETMNELTIEIHNWTQDDDRGSISFDVTVYKYKNTPNEIKKTITGGYIHGYKTDKIVDQDKIHLITSQQVITAVGISSNNAMLPTQVAQPSGTQLTNKTINGVSGLEVILSNWVADDDLGTITYSAEINKSAYNSKTIDDIELIGFKTNQNEMQENINDISTGDVETALSFVTHLGELPSEYIMPTSSLVNQSLHGVSGLTIKFDSWSSDDMLGSLQYGVTILKFGYSGKTITNTVSNFVTTYADQEAKYMALTATDISPILTTADSSKLASEITTPTLAPGVVKTINGVTDLSYDFNYWIGDDENGTISYSIHLAKANINAQSFADRTITGTISGFMGRHAATQKRITMISESQAKEAVGIKSHSIKVPSDITKPDVSQLNAKTINGVSGLTIELTNWVPDDAAGTITYDVSINDSSSTFTPKEFTSMTISGFLTTDDFIKKGLNEISDSDITNALGIVAPINSVLPTTIAQPADVAQKELHNIMVKITISDWIQHDVTGEITFAVSIVSTSVPALLRHVNVKLTGYQTIQEKIDATLIGADKTEIQAALVTAKFTGDSTIFADDVSAPSEEQIIELNGLKFKVAIDAASWTPDRALGQIVYTATITSLQFSTIQKVVTGLIISGFKIP